MMLFNVFQTLLASERLVLDHPDVSLGTTSPMLVLETTMFGRALSQLRLETEDLQKSPEIACDSSRACRLVFETNADDHVWGSVVMLRRDEARWLQKVLQEKLIRGGKHAKTKWRQFQGQLREKQRDYQDDHISSRSSDGFHWRVGGFSGFAGMGPGFTFVVR